MVAAVKAAGPVDSLEGTRPFAVLAPVSSAFDELPTGTVDNPLMPERIRW